MKIKDKNLKGLENEIKGLRLMSDITLEKIEELRKELAKAERQYREVSAKIEIKAGEITRAKYPGDVGDEMFMDGAKVKIVAFSRIGEPVIAKKLSSGKWSKRNYLIQEFLDIRALG